MQDAQRSRQDSTGNVPVEDELGDLRLRHARQTKDTCCATLLLSCDVSASRWRRYARREGRLCAVGSVEKWRLPRRCALRDRVSEWSCGRLYARYSVWYSLLIRSAA